MYNKRKANKTKLSQNKSYKGETIEMKINRIVNNKEPIKDGAPIIYTDRKNGVQPQYDIRTDRFEIAIEAMDKVTKSHLAKRDHRISERDKKTETVTEKNENKIIEKLEPIQATETK